MGWGSLLGDFAKEFAKGYVSERGVKGTLEDVGDLASSAKRFFSSADTNNDNNVSWEEITDFISKEVQEGNYTDALQALDEYYQAYENGQADVYYYYWRALILINFLEASVSESETFKEVDNALSEAIIEGRDFNDSDVNKEFKEISNRRNAAKEDYNNLERWSEMQSRFYDALNSDPKASLKLLESYYRKYEGSNYDYFYYQCKYEALIGILSKKEKDSNLESEIASQESLISQLKECYNGMKNQCDNPDDKQQETIEECESWIESVNRVSVNNKIELSIQRNDFENALNIAEREFKYSNRLAFLNAISRIESGRLEFLVDNNEQSIRKIEEAIKNSEEALTTVSSEETDSDTKAKRIEIVSQRIQKGKKYLMSLKEKESFVPAEKENKAPSVSENEKQYVEEIKACLADDGQISEKERRLLNRLRMSLGISEERAKDLEKMANAGGTLTEGEAELFAEYKECLLDGSISDKERRILDRLRKSLGISEERASELEKMASV